MDTLTVLNDYHRTAAEITPVSVYETPGGWVAVVRARDLALAARKLCGMADCTCTGPHCATDADGRVYSIQVAGPGRPRGTTAPNPRDRALKVALTEAEHQDLRAAAAEAGVTVSEYVRRRALGGEKGG